jgi:hypothetical protein
MGNVQNLCFFAAHASLLHIVYVSDSERPDVSGSIQSIKMYSYAQCTVQERLVCSGDVPCVAQEEQGSGPLHPEHLPPSPSTWGSGDSVYWSPSRRMDLGSEVEFAASPAQVLCLWIM